MMKLVPECSSTVECINERVDNLPSREKICSLILYAPMSRR